MHSYLLIVFVCLLVVCKSLLIPSTRSYQSSLRAGGSSRGSSFEDFFNRPGPWDDKDLTPMFEANRRWVQKMKMENRNIFEENQKGHSPKILWIGCADARVSPNEILGEMPGSVFTHRNIANMVVNTDFNLMSVIQYAVDALKVKHIIVCGHYDCGGIKASLQKNDHKAPLENWLRNIRDISRLHIEELTSIPDKNDRAKRLVELNVIEQCLNVFKTDAVQRRLAESVPSGRGNSFSEPNIHGCVFDPATGELNKLDVDFKSVMQELKGVYDLY